MRGQDMTNSRGRDRLDVEAFNHATTNAENMRYHDMQGKNFQDRLNFDRSKPIPGSPQSPQSPAKQQLATLIEQARGEIGSLSKLGATTSPDKPFYENMGARIGNSALGQELGKSFGTQEQTIRDNIANVKPRILNAIMAATGMSAKQLDSNTELKLALSALGDASQSEESQTKILDNLLETYVYGGKKPNTGGATGSWGDATDDDINHTAQKYGMTPEQVREFLQGQ